MANLRFTHHTPACALIVLLAACASGRPAPVAPQPRTHQDGFLGPGDALRVTVWRHPELSGDFTVGDDSTLLHPLFQTIKVAGVPTAVAKERLRQLLATYDQAVQLTVEPLVRAMIMGEVRTPSVYRLPQGTTVAQAVALAGGPTERGDMHQVSVIGRQGSVTFDLTQEHTPARNITVGSGDQVLVKHLPTFSFVNGVLVPVTSLMNAMISLIILSRL